VGSARGIKVKTLRAVNPQGWSLPPVSLYDGLKGTLDGNGLSSSFLASLIILAHFCLLVNMLSNPKRIKIGAAHINPTPFRTTHNHHIQTLIPAIP